MQANENRQQERSANSAECRGIPATLERKGGETRILSASFSDGAMVIPEVAADAAARRGGDFRIRGRLFGYHNWTRQPDEILEEILCRRAEGRGEEVRFVFEAEELEVYEGESLDEQSESTRARTLWEQFPDSGCFRKARPRTVAVTREVGGCHENSEVAVDVLYSTGWLDLETVEERLTRFAQTLAETKAVAAKLQDELLCREAYIEQQAPTADAGLEMIRRMAKEALARMETIRLHVGERPTDIARRQVLERPFLDADMVKELHREITGEFEALYPTRPASVPLERGACASRQRFDSSVYQRRETKKDPITKRQNVSLTHED